jgi:cob(I)alamin adenosyltransferase
MIAGGSPAPAALQSPPMGHRLSRIVTRTGDDGTTGLGDGTRTVKDAPRVHAMGEIDELSSALGLVLAESPPADVREILSRVQNDLFDLGGEICIPGRVAVGDAHVARLEDDVARLNERLPPLKEFVLPGGTRAGAAAHLARTVARRAERALVALHHAEPVAPAGLQYLNRLSDLLFVIARTLNRAEGVPESTWRHDRAGP